MRVQEKHDGATNDGADVAADSDKVSNTQCSCQMKPPLPINFRPCVLSDDSIWSRREIQMKADWLENLVGVQPQKTQTLRVWKRARAAEHLRSYLSGQWVRVWRGQGNNCTIGWLLITGWDVIRLGDMNEEDCCREGRPGMHPSEFLRQYLLTTSTTVDSLVYRLQFTFVACSHIKRGGAGVDGA